MQGRARRFEGLRWCAAPLLGCWIAVSAAPSAALDWQWGEVSGRLDYFASVGFSLRTQATNCRRIPNLTGYLGDQPGPEPEDCTGPPVWCWILRIFRALFGDG